jgi:RHS repeat-associated protein
MIQVDQAYGTNIQRSTYYQWDPSGRAIASKTDLNNNLSVVYGYDKLFRQTAATSRNEATSTWLSQTTTSYNDVEKKVATTSDLRQYLDGKLQAISYYDDLGRVRLVQKSDGVDLDGTGSNGIKIKTIDTYPTGGRRVVTSNPYRQLSDPTLEWTCTQYDVGGRVAAVAMFKGSNAPTDCENTYNRTGITRTAYDTDAVTITDPALKTRYQKHDALGRTVQVVEDPNGLGFNTSYLYNPLDNLTQVNQGSQTPRTFNYSSLSRLLSANNPESGTIQYQYYDSGELWQKTDARGVVTTMTYDALHRIQNKSYSNDNGSTPTVSYDYYKYAAEAPQIGQLKSVSSGVASTVYGYNALGKVSTSTHAITGYTGNLSFTYDWYLNGSQKDIYYPSGRQVHYTVDDAGRTLQVGVYADSLAYTPDGRATQMRLGNNLWETRNYLPPGTNSTSYMLETSQGIGDKLRLDYSFAEGANNGNVMQQQIQWPNHALIAQTYTYDAFNRLQTASEANGFNRTYEYDQFGNRSVLSSSGLAHVDPREPTSQSQINHMNNQLAMSGVSYDTAGNQTTFGSLSMNYDAENRTTTVSGAGSGTYSYDGDGRRVKKVWGATTTFYLYDALGRMAAEYSTETPTSAGTSYLFTDMLGSTRAITTNTGVMIECYDYLPFGRMLSDSDNGRSSVGCFQSNPDVQITGNVSQKFTGKERDQETGLDYFGARYYSGAQGRWMRPDPLLSSGRQTEPQSWNRYAYVLGNPLKYNDPTGLYEFADCSGNPKCAEYKKKFKNAVGAANKALASKSLPDDQAKSLSEVMNYLGDEGPGKGHGRIVFDAIKGRAAGQYAGNDRMIFDMGKIDKLSQRPDPGNIKYDSTTILGSVIAHETSHDLDDSKGLLPTYFENNPHVVGMFETSERNAYNIGSYVFKGLNATDPSGSWRTNWVTEGLSTVDKETLRGIGVENGVKRSMEDIRKQGK